MELRPFELRSQVQTLEQQLAAAYKSNDEAWRDIQQLREQLAALQAAIVHYNDAIRPLGQPKIPTDTAALDAAIAAAVQAKAHEWIERSHRLVAAAQQPLVELLGECRCKLDWCVVDGEFIERIDAQLAKVKEGKYPLPDGRTH
jgi:hypothetical protein